MKRTVKTLACTAMLLFCLSACENNSTKIVADNENYTITSTGNDYYLNIKSVSGVDRSEHFDACIFTAAGMSFESMDEMRTKLIENKLTEQELSQLQHGFRYDDTGTMSIFNITDPLVPTLPAQVTVKSVYWSGNSYSYSLKYSDIGSGYIHCYTEEIFTRNYDEDYVNFLDNPLFTLVEKKEISDQNATEYYYTTSKGYFKTVQYMLKRGSKTVFVSEKYVLETDNDLCDESDTVPYQISLYIFDNKNVCEVKLFDPISRPAKEFLLSFGVE